jgi:NADPH:quinone reductase-like Zn-dependent oxidoreductase
MQAAGIDAFGGEVRMLELEAPGSPAPDEVLISVRAAGVGNWDEFVRVGNWDVGRRPPLALGVEAAGVRDAAPGGHGVGAAVNAARDGAATALEAVADDGRLATITGDPPPPERGITVADVYVRPDGERLSALAAALAEGVLTLQVGATLPLAEAAAALRDAVSGRVGGASVLTLEPNA